MDILITDNLLSTKEYVNQKTKKDTIFLHHTAGGHRADWTINTWNTDSRGRISTSYVISGASTAGNDYNHDGRIFRAFPDEFWSWHLGVTGTNGFLDKKSIGIEICNYGWLTTNKYGQFFNYVKKQVPENMVYDLGFEWKKYRYFHKYTDKQIESTYKLLLFLKNKHGIQISKNWDINSFNINNNALNGEGGLYTHVNVRKDKTDCHPQPELIQMLNSL